MGNFEKALDEMCDVLRGDPNSQSAAINVASTYVNLNRFDEAEAVYKQAEARHLGGRASAGYSIPISLSEDRFGTDGKIGCCGVWQTGS